MIKLIDLVPTNLEEEKAKFFAADAKYNPQFTYEKAIPSSALLKQGKPKWRHLRLAKKIVKQAVKDRLLANPEMLFEVVLTQEALTQRINDYLANYQLQNQYQLMFSSDYVSRFAVNFKNNAIKVRLPITVGEKELRCVLDHEIGTHVLRQENYLQQPWYKKRRRYGLQDHLATEEGLAGLHFLLSKDDYLNYVTALKYLGIDLANKKDFKTVYAFFQKHFLDEDRAWTYTLKIKRGLNDTSQRAALNTGIVYFEGFIEILKYLRRQHFDPSDLYFGKASWKDVEKIKKLNPSYQPILPKFYTDDPQLYQSKIKAIAKRNFIY